MTERLILKDLCRYEIGTYAEVIYRNALFYPKEEAFVYGKERVTFSRFNARVNGVIHALASMGIKKGDVLGILSWNCMESYDLRSLKRIWYAASPMPVEILRTGMDLFSPIFMQAFGQSESGPSRRIPKGRSLRGSYGPVVKGGRKNEDRPGVPTREQRREVRVGEPKVRERPILGHPPHTGGISSNRTPQNRTGG